MDIYIYIYISTIYQCLYISFHFKQKAENRSQVIFLNLVPVCSSCKRKFVVCPFVYEEKNVSYLFANGLNGLVHL